MITETDLRIITLEEAKQNSRIDTSDEDAILLRKCKTAEESILKVLNRTIEDLYEEYGTIPSPIVDACLAMTDHLFTHRGITSPLALHDIPYTIDFMVKPYIKL